MRKLLLVVASSLLAITATVGLAGTAAARPGVSDAGRDDQARYGRCFRTAMRTIVVDAMREPQIRSDPSRLTGAMAEADSRCQPGTKDQPNPLTTTLAAFDDRSAVAILTCDRPRSIPSQGGSIFSWLTFSISCQEPAGQ
jgi:hypothetical protein